MEWFRVAVDKQSKEMETVKEVDAKNLELGLIAYNIFTMTAQ